MNAYLRFVLAMLIFGSIGLFVRAVPLESSLIVAARTVLGSLFLLLVLALRRRKPDLRSLRRQLPALLFTGAVMGVNWLFLFAAYRCTTVSVATLVYYFAPVIVLFLSPLLFKEKLSRSRIAALCAALLGMLLVNGTAGGGSDPRRGFFLALLAAVFYAGLMLLNKRISGVPPVEKTLVQLLGASAVMTLYAVCTHRGALPALSGGELAALLTIGIVHTGIAYLLYISAMQELPGQSVALCSYIDPASALLFSALFLHEQLSPLQLLGAALILCGSACGELFGRKRGS